MNAASGSAAGGVCRDCTVSSSSPLKFRSQKNREYLMSTVAVDSRPTNVGVTSSSSGTPEQVPKKMVERPLPAPEYIPGFNPATGTHRRRQRLSGCLSPDPGSGRRSRARGRGCLLQRQGRTRHCGASVIRTYSCHARGNDVSRALCRSRCATHFG